eukprot:2351270-Pyramimonas_sp.AAC.1
MPPRCSCPAHAFGGSAEWREPLEQIVRQTRERARSWTNNMHRSFDRWRDSRNMKGRSRRGSVAL